MSPTVRMLAVAWVLAAHAPAGAAADTRAEPAAADEVGRRPAGRTRDEARARIVAAARRHLGQPFRGDCSSFVRRVYDEARVPLPASPRARSGTEAIVRPLARTSRPRRGDLAYFHRTHDREPPGPGRNLFTHVGIVESVDGPRVSLLHRSNTGVERLSMHLGRRGDARVNDPLRRRKAGDPPAQRYLASQLLAGFVSPFSPQRAAARSAHGRAGAHVARERARPADSDARLVDRSPVRDRPRE